MTLTVESTLHDLKDHLLVPIDGGKDVTGFYLKDPDRTRIMSTLILFTPEGIVIHGDYRPGHHGVISCYGYGLNWFAGRLSERYLCEKFLEQGWHREVAERELQDIIDDIESGDKKKIADWEHLDILKDVQQLMEEREALHEDLVNLRKGYKKDVAAKEDPQELEAQKKEIASFRKDLLDARTRYHKAIDDAIGTLKTVLRDLQYSDQGSFYQQYHDEIDEDAEHLPGWDYEPTTARILIAIQKTFSRLYNKGKEIED
ncbi:MAG: hypothetical protein GTO63_28935 [Anaerolineae bacterium]|nr:hypothetical protein [Anaerolineae bacterium]NIQ81681.1 hypothetical protein [Anaerolineae bacterium]